MYKQIKIQVPATPNFILADDLKQPIPIADFTDAELRAVGDAWTQALVTKARTRRNSRHTETTDVDPGILENTDRPLNEERE